MEEIESDKTEQATPFKLDRSRRKGVVARGTDLGFLVGISTLLTYARIEGPLLIEAISRMARASWVEGPQLADGHYALLAASASLISMLIRPLLLFFAIVFSAVLLFEFVQTGVVFSAQPLKPDFTRLNPANGFKRVFSLRALIEAGKSILKILVYSTIGILIIRGAAEYGTATVSDARSLVAELRSDALRLLSAIVLGAILFAVIDQIIVRNMFTKKMRMSRRELRRETRDREGEPRLKQRRKQLHRELAKASQSLRGLRKADVLVTNPQHIAIALRYDHKAMVAPMYVSIGVNHLAQRMKRLAFLYSIPVVENRLLAQMLYRKAALNGAIPQECYRPVADIYNSMRARKEKERLELSHA
jgi:flagellar biosynthetic protein FlhB